MNVAAKLGLYVAGLAVVFAAAFGLGNATGGTDDPADERRAPTTTVPAHPHDEEGS